MIRSQFVLVFSWINSNIFLNLASTFYLLQILYTKVIILHFWVQQEMIVGFFNLSNVKYIVRCFGDKVVNSSFFLELFQYEIWFYVLVLEFSFWESLHNIFDFWWLLFYIHFIFCPEFFIASVWYHVIINKTELQYI